MTIKTSSGFHLLVYSMVLICFRAINTDMIDAAFLVWLVNTFGLLGVFLGSLIGSASIFFPVPSFIFVIAAGSLLNPLAVGIAAGLGAAIGEMVGYIIGLGIRHGHRKIRKNKKDNKTIKILREWFQKKKLGFFVVIAFAATPLPDDIVGIFCGIIKYDAKKFFLAMLIGKIALGLVLAYAGFYGLRIADGFL